MSTATAARSLDQFIKDLPDLVAGKRQVVIATYNNLDNYPDGGSFVAPNGIMVHILCGGGVYAYLDTEFGSVPIPGAQETKTIGAVLVTAGLEHVGTDTLVVLYAGVSRFNEMSRLAYHLADRGVKTALVACGCDEDVFDDLEPHENIISVMPHNNCCNGGRNDLSRIADQFLD